MANLGPVAGRRQGALLAQPVGQVIARYASYAEAQRAVDFLSDSRFPVQAVTIVGTDLRTVERVTGRLSYGRVALAGGLSGAWFGLFVGLILSLFAQGPGGGVFAAVLIGAGFGMMFGVISFAATGGRRDFTSQSAIIASEYQVLCRDEQVRAAMEVLGRLPHAHHGTAVPPGSPGAPPGPWGTDPYGAPPSQAPPSSGGPWGPSPTPPHAPGAPAPLAPVNGAHQDPPTEGATGAEDRAAGEGSDGAGAGAGAGSAEPAPVGLTYGEVMEQRRKEQRERDAAERARRATDSAGQ
jgi:hypothetical protein